MPPVDQMQQSPWREPVNVSSAASASGCPVEPDTHRSAGVRSLPATSYSGSSTIALPPPRRTGSAAASTRPSASSSMPVAAPISAVSENR